MRARALIAGLAVFIAGPVAADETYVLDPVHSQPVFEVRHIGYSLQFGNFARLAGKVTLDRAAKTGTVEVTIDAASIRSFDPRLDGVLKGERFFNVEKYPTVTFRSSKVSFDGDRVVGVDGELTMLGVTKPANLKITSFACGENPFNKRSMCGGDATAVIKRSDWGMTNGLNIGNPSDDVTLRIPIEAYKE